MKFAIIALAAATAVSGQLVYEDGEFKCLGPAEGKNFCAGDSLQTNIIIRCTGTKGQPGNCNNNLAGVPPIGVKTSATCYQTSNTTGDGACSFNGIVYSDSGESFPVPGASSSSYVPPVPTYGASSSSSIYVPPVPTYGASSSSAPEPYPTTSSSIYYPTVSYSNTTSTIYYPPSTTLTTIETTTAPVPTNTYVPPPPPPPSNTTSTYTTGLPIPTQSPSSAGALLAKDSLVLGVVALVGFMFL